MKKSSISTNNLLRHRTLPGCKASKLALSEYDSKLTAREELGLSGWANTVWDWLMFLSKFISNSA